MAFLISFAKTLHILSATIFFGAGLMSAWCKVRADRSADVRVVASIAGFAVATGCWLPAAWLQLRMRALAEAAAVFIIWVMVAKRLGA